MTSDNEPDLDMRAQRLKSVLENLADRGISQAQVAAKIGVTRQYLNDILGGRRPLSELFARRLGEHFQADYAWLMGQKPTLRPPAEATAGMADTSVWLPVVPHPVEIDPRLHPRWQGSFVQVPAVALSKLATAIHPYVLQFRQPDVEGRLHKNDLVLVSQVPDESAEIVVVRTGRKCYLARRKGSGWVRVANREALGSDSVVVGHCLGILWSALS